MKTLHKSVLIWFDPQRMFDVVTDVNRYCEFLPWCNESQVIERFSNGMNARIGMRLAGLKQSFTTHNVHHIKTNGGLGVDMALIEGPFSTLHGSWTFDPIGGATEETQAACKVTLKLQYKIENKLLQLAIGAAFEKIASSLVDAFVERAKKIYV